MAILLNTAGYLNCQGSTLTLAWDPSPAPNAASYTIYYGPTSGNYTNTVSVGLVTTATVSGLTAGGTYYFAATVTDDSGLESVFSAEVSYAVPIPIINQPPTLNPLPNITVLENAGLQAVNLAGITSGASNQVQVLSVTAVSGNPSVIPTPTVNYSSPSATGTLSLQPVASAYGSALITVTVNNGGASNNVVTKSFTVTVVPVNQPPTLNGLANLTINENAPGQVVSLSGIGSGAANQLQTLTVTASSSNPSVIPNPAVNYSSPSATGTLSLRPAASAYGTAQITVTVNNGGASNNVVSRSFTVTVDQPPTISALSNIVIAVNTRTAALPFTISDSQTAVSNLTLVATSSNMSLVTETNIFFAGTDTNRTVTIKPIADQSGTATITVTVSDSIASASSTFELSVLQRPAPPQNIRISMR